MINPDIHCRILAFAWKLQKIYWEISFFLFRFKWGITIYETDYEDSYSIWGETKYFGSFVASYDGESLEGPVKLASDYERLLSNSSCIVDWVSSKLGYYFDWDECGVSYSNFDTDIRIDSGAYETDWTQFEIGSSS